MSSAKLAACSLGRRYGLAMRRAQASCSAPVGSMVVGASSAQVRARLGSDEFGGIAVLHGTEARSSSRVQWSVDQSPHNRPGTVYAPSPVRNEE